MSSSLAELNGKHVLVTGGCGFIGSEVTKQLSHEGAKITILDNLSSGKNEFVEKLLNSKKYDVKNYLSKNIGKKIRKIPEIKFIIDNSEHQASKIDIILSNLNIPPK